MLIVMHVSLNILSNQLSLILKILFQLYKHVVQIVEKFIKKVK